MSENNEKKTEKATFAAGCFWGAEEAFRKVNGIEDAEVGYMDGAEVVNVDFDPQQISYDDLLNVFWESHSSDMPSGGLERSEIFTHSEAQAAAAQAAKEGKSKSGTVNTKIAPNSHFQRAEEKHQRYYEKRGKS